MSLALSGCDDFLTKEPETNLSPNTFFSSEAELELWTNRFYSLFAGPDTDAIQVSDIQIAKNLSSVQQGTRSPATENWGTSAWAYLRYINYYLERSGNCPDETISQRAAKDILDRAGVRVPKESKSDVVIRFASGAPPLGMPESAEARKGE